MSFDRDSIEALRDRAARLASQSTPDGEACAGALAEVDGALTVCLDEVDRLIDEVTVLQTVKTPTKRNVQRLCDVAATNLERAERAETQVRQYQAMLIKVIESVHHRAAQQIAWAALAETEGP